MKKKKLPVLHPVPAVPKLSKAAKTAAALIVSDYIPQFIDTAGLKAEIAGIVQNAINESNPPAKRAPKPLQGHGFNGLPAIKRVVVRGDGLMYGGNEADGVTPRWSDSSASIFDLSYPSQHREAANLCAAFGARTKRWCDATRKSRT